MARGEGETRRSGWLDRRRAAKRAKAERTGDTPEKRAERPSDQDVQDAASGAAVRGTVATPPSVGGLGGGGGL